MPITVLPPKQPEDGGRVVDGIMRFIPEIWSEELAGKFYPAEKLKIPRIVNWRDK